MVTMIMECESESSTDPVTTPTQVTVTLATPTVPKPQVKISVVSSDIVAIPTVASYVEKSMKKDFDPTVYPHKPHKHSTQPPQDRKI